MADSGALGVVKVAWEKWVAGDLDGFVKLWAPDGVWTLPGQNRISGRFQGHEQIAEVARLAFEISGGTLKAEPIELAASGEDSVLGYFHLEAQRPGASINQNALQRWVIRESKIVSLDNVYPDTPETDEFFK